jgi:hypothetical protein
MSTYRKVRRALADQQSEQMRLDGLEALKAKRDQIAKAACPACTEAEGNPLTGSYQQACPECRARAIAGGPTYFAAARAGAYTPEYETLMTEAFGEDWRKSHAKVKAWSDRFARYRLMKENA